VLPAQSDQLGWMDSLVYQGRPERQAGKDRKVTPDLAAALAPWVTAEPPDLWDLRDLLGVLATLECQDQPVPLESVEIQVLLELLVSVCFCRLAAAVVKLL